jgi:hypothetical protein
LQVVEVLLEVARGGHDDGAAWLVGELQATRREIVVPDGDLLRLAAWRGLPQLLQVRP